MLWFNFIIFFNIVKLAVITIDIKSSSLTVFFRAKVSRMKVVNLNKLITQ